MHKKLYKQLQHLGIQPGKHAQASKLVELYAAISDEYQLADAERDQTEILSREIMRERRETAIKENFGESQHISALFEILPDMLMVVDTDATIIDIVSNKTGQTRLPISQILNQPLAKLMPATQKDFTMAVIQQAVNTREMIEYEFEFQRPDELVIFDARAIATDLWINGKQTVFFLLRDITENAMANKRLQHMAEHDSLTGLYNRAQLDSQLNDAIIKADSLGEKFAVFMTDLDRFKQINDSLGHQIGDDILRQSAKRLADCCGSSSNIARFGGDEFVIILEKIYDRTSTAQLANDILDAFSHPLAISNFSYEISTSIGIAIYPDDATTPSDLLRCADNALYASKDAGRNQFNFYTEALSRENTARLLLESELRAALVEQQFSLAYQPKFCLASGNLAGFEVLLRWHNKRLGDISPMDFIPLAELSGLIVDIGLWTVAQVLRQVVQWQGDNYHCPRIAINISSRQLSSAKLPFQIKALLNRYHLPGSCLEFEVTESLAVDSNSQAQKNLITFSQMGIDLSIDDFGTGHSSLANLKLLPLNNLKIDQSFVAGLGQNAADEAIVGATISMAKRLGLGVIAEGVEKDRQLSFLMAQGCDMAQGFLLAKPMLASEAEHLLNSARPAAAKFARAE